MIRFSLPAAVLALALPMSAMAAEPAPVRIPLVQGLVDVVVVQGRDRDEEQAATITAATPEYVDFSVEFRSFANGKPHSDTFTRRIRRVDLATSNRLNQVFQDGDAATFPGSTMSLLSAATLAELKAKGSAAMVIGTLPMDEAVGSSSVFAQVPSGRKYFRGTLARIGTAAEPVTVLVNGVATKLPTIHGKGVFTVGGDSVELEMWFVDDPSNALLVKSRTGKLSSQTVRLDFPVAQPRAATLQKALSDGSCRAQLNGIYFDSGKASLLPQSAPALKAVADLMKANPAWTLRVEGHTDNVGAAAFNLDLSKRRAAAVRDALAAQYQLPAARLVASGFGATKPVAVNTTLEGRAANRRVELARTCP